MRSINPKVLALVVLVMTGFAGAARAAEDGQVVSVAKRDFAAARLGRRGLDLLMEKNGRVYLVATPGEIAALAAVRVACVIESPRLLQAAGMALSAGGGINGAYHSTLELETDLRILERDHPGLASVQEIGETLEKRKIYALKISDNASADEHEPAACRGPQLRGQASCRAEVPHEGQVAADGGEMRSVVLHLHASL